jgi:hypothetical protein
MKEVRWNGLGSAARKANVAFEVTDAVFDAAAGEIIVIHTGMKAYGAAWTHRRGPVPR